MKKIFASLIAAITIAQLAFSIETPYFLSQPTSFNPAIPSPHQYFEREYGKWHITHNELVSYLKTISEKSDRVIMKEIGKTHEQRPLYHLIISSPENLSNIEEIRVKHTDFSRKEISEKDPVVIWLGYSIHGNEASAGNASVLTAYYLLAGQSDEIKNLLDNAIIILDPVLNPDGFQRAAMWSNMHQSNTLTIDGNSRQFSEAWPGGRTNHYWLDMNRDWLPLTQPESRARLAQFHFWKPNIVNDHHEMGSGGTFFFQPGVPSRNNHLTPEKNYDLTRLIATYHSKFLQNIRTLHFTEEGFDDFYYGKGSTYPDVNGAIGILFEQSRVRGEAVLNDFDTIYFANAIKNQFTTSLSSIRAGIENKKELLQYQLNFYNEATTIAANNDIKAYVINDNGNPFNLQQLVNTLIQHKIDVYAINKNISIAGNTFNKNSSVIVPLNQAQYRLITTIFEENTTFNDSLFYDVSAWNLALANNLNYNTINNTKLLNEILGQKITTEFKPTVINEFKLSNIGYLVEVTNSNIYSFVYELLQKNIHVRSASQEFSAVVNGQTKEFSYGTLFIPASYQSISSADLHNILKIQSQKHNVSVNNADKVITPSGIDLGSRSFIHLQLPKILVTTGDGIRSYSAGEIWYYLDFVHEINSSIVDFNRLSRIDLNNYTHIILPDGVANINAQLKSKLENWIKNGGNLITFGEMTRELINSEIIQADLKKNLKMNYGQNLPFGDRRLYSGARSLGGAIFSLKIDNSHPIAYGYANEYVPVFKNSYLAAELSSNPFSNPLIFETNNFVCGYLHDDYSNYFDNTSQIIIHNKGNGTIISFLFNPNFRGFWNGSHKFLMNGLFFVDMM